MGTSFVMNLWFVLHCLENTMKTQAKIFDLLFLTCPYGQKMI